MMMISIAQKASNSISLKRFLMTGGKLGVWMVVEKVWFLVITLRNFERKRKMIELGLDFVVFARK